MKINYIDNDNTKSFLLCNDFVFIVCIDHGHVVTWTFVKLDHKCWLAIEPATRIQYSSHFHIPCCKADMGLVWFYPLHEM